MGHSQRQSSVEELCRRTARILEKTCAYLKGGDSAEIGCTKERNTRSKLKVEALVVGVIKEIKAHSSCKYCGSLCCLPILIAGTGGELAHQDPASAGEIKIATGFVFSHEFHREVVEVLSIRRGNLGSQCETTRAIDGDSFIELPAKAKGDSVTERLPR